MSTASRLPRAFWPYLTGIAATALGDAILSIAVPYVTLTVTGTSGAPALSAVVLAGTLPRLLGPLLGSVADRTPPHQVFFMTSAVRALAVTLCGTVLLQGQLPLAILLALAFLNGLLATLAYAAGSAFVPRLVPAAHLSWANSLSSGAAMGLPLIGYGLGGGLLHLLGSAGTFLISVPTFLILTVMSGFLPRLSAATVDRPNVLADLRVGWGVVRTSRVLLSLLSLSFTLNLAMNIMNVRSPLHLRDVGRGAPDYAVFEMLISGGVLLGIGLVGPLSKRLTLDMLIGVGRWILTVGTAGFLWSPVLAWWSAAAVFGLGLGLLEVAAITRAQQVVPSEVRGRVLGTMLALNALGLSLGAGVAAWPVETSVLLAGVTGALLLLAVLWTWTIRSGQSLTEQAQEAMQ